MHFDCSNKEFSDAVTLTAAAASARTSFAILQMLKIDATPSGIRILGCDGEMWIEQQMACLVTEPGTICIRARTLADVVNVLSANDITVKSAESSTIVISQGGSEYNLQISDPADFPEPPAVASETYISLTFAEFKQAVDAVSFAVSSDVHKQVLNGVNMTYDGKSLLLVATDTHRLAHYKLDKPGIGSDVQAVVPEKALRAIRALGLKDDDTIDLRFSGDKITVEANGAKIVAMLLAGTFPNWQRVVPSESTRTWKMEAEGLKEVLKKAMIIARDSSNKIRFQGDGDQIVVSAHSDEKGDAKEVLPVLSTNGDLSIAFNGRYVQEAVSVVSGDSVLIEMTEHTRPAIVKSAEDSGYFCVIMPVHLG